MIAFESILIRRKKRPIPFLQPVLVSTFIFSMGVQAQSVAMDDFERATLGPKWSIAYPPSGNQVQILDNSDLGMAAGPQGFFLVHWVGSTFTADQFCEAVLPLDGAQDWAHQLYVRYRQADSARYGFHYNNDPNQTLYYGKWCFKYDGRPGAQTRNFGCVAGLPPNKPGDTIRVEIRGFTLTGYLNGTQMIQATDTASNRIVNGIPGLAARIATGNQNLTQNAKAWESWKGGGLESAILRVKQESLKVRNLSSLNFIYTNAQGRSFNKGNESNRKKNQSWFLVP